MFKISLSQAKKKFYRSVNSIFSKIGRYANEDMILHLVYSKCIPVILYGLDACGVSLPHSRLLKFITGRLGMKIFRTRSLEIVEYSLSIFGYHCLDILAEQRCISFQQRYAARDNLISCFFRAYDLLQ